MIFYNVYHIKVMIDNPALIKKGGKSMKKWWIALLMVPVIFISINCTSRDKEAESEITIEEEAMNEDMFQEDARDNFNEELIYKKEIPQKDNSMKEEKSIEEEIEQGGEGEQDEGYEAEGGGEKEGEEDEQEWNYDDKGNYND